MAELDAFVALADELGPVLLSDDDRTGLTAVCEVARVSTGSQSVSIAALDEDAAELHYVAAAGRAADEILGTRLEISRGIAGFVASSAQAVHVSDVRGDPRFASDVAEAVGYVPTGLAAVPVLHQDRVLGVLSLLDAVTVDMSLVSTLGTLAGPYLQRGATAATFGRVVSRALADRSNDASLADALRDAATSAEGPAADLAEMAAVYAELDRLGPEDRQAATRILAQFTAHAAGSRPVPVRRTRR